jgi:hypothetical protein
MIDKLPQLSTIDKYKDRVQAVQLSQRRAIEARLGGKGNGEKDSSKED